MNKFLAMLIIIMLLFSPVIMAQDATDNSLEEEEITQEESTEMTNDLTNSTTDNSAHYSTEKQTITWEAMNEMQIALFMINKQIDYLMERIADSDIRIKAITDTYEERLEKEIARNQELTMGYEEKIKNLEQDIVEYRDNISQLERDNAIFASESGLYLKILIGFLAGSIFGIIIAGLLQLWRKARIQKTNLHQLKVPDLFSKIL